MGNLSNLAIEQEPRWRHAIIQVMEKPKTHSHPLIIAHRGASALAPENTLAAFRLALELGADGIELDVMLSADKQLVVIHDVTVDRTTNGTGKVPELAYTQLRDLDAGIKFAKAMVGEHLPTLSEVFDLVGDKMLINVELKNYHAPFDDLAEHVVRLIDAHGLTKSTILSSFNGLNARKARALNPSIPFGLLTEPGIFGAVMRGPVGQLFGYQALHPYYKDVTEQMVQALHKREQQCNVWTVDDPKALLKMKQYWVDAVICNDPAAARTLLEG
jgi:glycerophosphoryl diester phosphodiesterase